MRINEFLGYFYPDPHEEIHLRAIRPKKADIYPISAKLTCTRDAIQSDKDTQTALAKWNKTHGLYFVVNAGGDKDDEISRINAVFCEMDDVPLQRQIDMYLEEGPLTPSLMVETKKSIHAYWLLEETLLPNEFVTIQKGLIKHFNSDEKICNPSRVMRLPFLDHIAHTEQGIERKRCEVIRSFGFRYTYTELAEAFPYTPPKPRPPRKVYVTNSDDLGSRLVEQIKASEWFHVKGEYGYTKGLCHNGNGDQGVWVHLRTGAVKCFAKCEWDKIREAFGVYKR